MGAEGKNTIAKVNFRLNLPDRGNALAVAKDLSGEIIRLKLSVYSNTIFPL